MLFDLATAWHAWWPASATARRHGSGEPSPDEPTPPCASGSTSCSSSQTALVRHPWIGSDGRLLALVRQPWLRPWPGWTRSECSG
jgi:hypothetical protein